MHTKEQAEKKVADRYTMVNYKPAKLLWYATQEDFEQTCLSDVDCRAIWEVTRFTQRGWRWQINAPDEDSIDREQYRIDKMHVQVLRLRLMQDPDCDGAADALVETCKQFLNPTYSIGTAEEAIVSHLLADLDGVFDVEAIAEAGQWKAEKVSSGWVQLSSALFAGLALQSCNETERARRLTRWQSARLECIEIDLCEDVSLSDVLDDLRAYSKACEALLGLESCRCR